MEKFDELMYKAGLTADGCWDQVDDYDKEAIMKFGELIVRECAQVGFDYNGGTVCEISAVILEHFGVEE